MPSVDLALIACFALAELFCSWRDSLLCLFLLLASIAVFMYPISPSDTHLLTSVIYSASVVFFSLTLKKIILSISVFQYIMAIDAYLFPQTETILFTVYPCVTFALNLLLLSSLGKGKRFGNIKDTRFFGFFGRRSANIRRMAEHTTSRKKAKR